MRNKLTSLCIVALFLLAQVVVLAEKPADVAAKKAGTCAGNSHVCWDEYGIKVKDPELFPGNGAPEAVQGPPAKGERGIIGRAGNSNNAFVELWRKNPDTWEVLIDQAWGKLRYNVEGPEFAYHFTGHMLEPGIEYALIVYIDPWPGTGGALLASGTADEDGDLMLKGSMDLNGDLEEAKIWLVYADDYDGEKMTSWNPDGYLFEYDLISYTDTDS